MDPFHLLIVPIACLASRQLFSASIIPSMQRLKGLNFVDTISDMNRYEEAVDKLFDTLNCTSIKFERF